MTNEMLFIRQYCSGRGEGYDYKLSVKRTYDSQKIM